MFGKIWIELVFLSGAPMKSNEIFMHIGIFGICYSKRRRVELKREREKSTKQPDEIQIQWCMRVSDFVCCCNNERRVSVRQRNNLNSEALQYLDFGMCTLFITICILFRLRLCAVEKAEKKAVRLFLIFTNSKIDIVLQRQTMKPLLFTQMCIGCCCFCCCMCLLYFGGVFIWDAVVGFANKFDYHYFDYIKILLQDLILNTCTNAHTHNQQILQTFFDLLANQFCALSHLKTLLTILH